MQKSKVVAVAARLKMTPMQQAAYTAALMAEAGRDSSNISASYSNTDESRIRVARNIVTTVRDQWIVPKLLTLHWDAKVMLHY